MRGVGAAVLVTSRAVCVGNGHACSGGLADVERRTVAAEELSWGPFRQCGNGWRGVLVEFVGGMHDLAIDHSEDAFDAGYLVFRHCEVVIGEDGEVGELACGKGAFFAALARKPTAALGVKPQGFFATEAIPAWIQRGAAYCRSGDQRIEGKPGGITGDSCGVWS